MQALSPVSVLRGLLSLGPQGILALSQLEKQLSEQLAPRSCSCAPASPYLQPDPPPFRTQAIHHGRAIQASSRRLASSFLSARLKPGTRRGGWPPWDYGDGIRTFCN